MGVPNEAQSDTVKAVRAMQDADRTGARQPTPGGLRWADARTVQMNVAGDELLFEIIRAESGEVELIVDVLADGGLRIRERCGEHAPAGEEAAPEWVTPEMTCVRWEHHEPPHRVTRRGSVGPFFEWQDVDAMGADYLAMRAAESLGAERSSPAYAETRAAIERDDEQHLAAVSDDEYTRQLDALMGAYAPLRERWRRYAAADAERRDAAPVHPAARWAADVRSKMERLAREDAKEKLRAWAAEPGAVPSQAALDVAQHDAARYGVGYLVDGIPMPAHRVLVVRGPLPLGSTFAPDLVSRMCDARDALRQASVTHEGAQGGMRAVAGALRWLEEGIVEGSEWRLRVAAARELVDGEPHVCTCDHVPDHAGAPVVGCSNGFDSACRFEAALRALVA